MTSISPTSAIEAENDLISLATGDVRFDVYGLGSQPLARSIDQAYPAAAGARELREAVARDTQATCGAKVNADDVVVTPGARLAILLTLRIVTTTRSEVLLPTPYWGSYPEVINASGGRLVLVPGVVGQGRIDLDALESLRTPATGAVIINSPRNPDGAVTPSGDIEAVMQWAARHEVTVVFDQVYRGLSVPDQLAPSPLDYIDGLPPNCAVIDGLTKSSALAGLRIGWAIASPLLRQQITALASHLIGGVSSTAQDIALNVLTAGPARRAVIAENVERNVQDAAALLDAIPGVQCQAPAGGLFLFPDLREWIATAPPEAARDLPGWLRHRHRVAVVDGSAFGAPGHLRLCAGVPADELGEGLRRLTTALEFARR